MIDTSVLIDLYKAKKLEEYAGSAISIVTLFEFVRGIPSERKRVAVLKRLEKLFKVEPLDNVIILTASKIYRYLKGKGKLIDDADIIIGATAIAKGYTVWTTNIDHFERMREFGVKLYKPQKR
ncbi:Ribonuclease VapC1 [Thermococcus nautili]|uniref:type II toxin-antitoxin system VapC family toxin n=1 Tax=Thermococcus nautili TaxID=195522 RepID=UPI0025536E6C|nr:type II toxin-antitoxin system VapC family toxin [Thermococcus nautili]CAI1492888.1 Ribonuclease VapC1 [Thermococcus nautili]